MRNYNIFFLIEFNFNGTALKIDSLITLFWLKRYIFWLVRSVFPGFIYIID